MKEDPGEDRDPRSEPVLKNQIAAYDEMRQRCPEASSRHGIKGRVAFRKGVKVEA